MDTSRRLILLHPSPWSERARWVLEHHGLAYTPADYLPIVGEIELRRLARGRKERLTVPALVVGEEAHCDSWDIALYADREGKGEKLVPSELEGDVRAWNDLADSGMGGARARVLEKMLAMPEAMDASAPSFLPRWARPLLRPAARWTIRRLQRKYQTRAEESTAHLAQLRAALDRLRAGLASGQSYLLGRFTYADIVMATLVQAVLPVNDRFFRLEPATRAVWTEPALVDEYRDLIAWRDTIYERYRGRVAT